MSAVNASLVAQIERIEQDKETFLYFWASGGLLMTVLLSDGYHLLVAESEEIANRMLSHFYTNNNLGWKLRKHDLTSIHCVLDAYPNQDIVGYMIWDQNSSLKLFKFGL